MLMISWLQELVKPRMETNAKLKGKRKMLDAWWKIYRQMVRTLIYLIISRLDIAYDVSIFNKFMQAPKHTHMVIVKWILRYVKGAINLDWSILIINCLLSYVVMQIVYETTHKWNYVLIR